MSGGGGGSGNGGGGGPPGGGDRSMSYTAPAPPGERGGGGYVEPAPTHTPTRDTHDEWATVVNTPEVKPTPVVHDY